MCLELDMSNYMEVNMSEKVHIEKGSVQETLMIPLVARSMGADLYPSIYTDQGAKRILDNVDYDLSVFEKKSKSLIARYGYLEAAKRYGDMMVEIREYLDDHPCAAIVNLGCGLDTTSLQCDNGKCRFYNIDFPDVIAARNELAPPMERETNIACDMLDTSWFDLIDSTGGAVFFAAGVFYYIKREDAKNLFIAMAKRFPGGKISFDSANRKACKLMLKTWIKGMGMNDVDVFLNISDPEKELGEWSPRFKVSSKGYLTGYGELDKSEINGFFRFLCRFSDKHFAMRIVSIAFSS